MSLVKFLHVFFFTTFLVAHFSYAQDYHALNGSKYAGVMSVYNNPASPVNQASIWDVSYLSLQANINNNIFRLTNFSLGHLGDAKSVNINGKGNRDFDFTGDMSIANYRCLIDNDQAISFGLRVRTYNHLHTGSINYDNSFNTTNKFIAANINNKDVNFALTHDIWSELFVNYSRVLKQDALTRLTVGVTLGYLRNISGAYVNAKNLSFSQIENPSTDIYHLDGASIDVKYSRNYDSLTNSNKPLKVEAGRFLADTKGSPSLSFGIEYLIKDGDNYTGRELELADYNWKLGAGVMDIGFNTFSVSSGAFNATLPNVHAGTHTIENKVNSTRDVINIRDTLKKYFYRVDTFNGPFHLYLPTRLLLSADKALGSHFYVNAQASIDLFGKNSRVKNKTWELGFITVTPRWETRLLGAYFPIQINTVQKLYAGAAIKLGPLLFGLHNIGWLFGKIDALNGGGYIAFHYTPPPREAKLPRAYQCPY